MGFTASIAHGQDRGSSPLGGDRTLFGVGVVFIFLSRTRNTKSTKGDQYGIRHLALDHIWSLVQRCPRPQHLGTIASLWSRGYARQAIIVLLSRVYKLCMLTWRLSIRPSKRTETAWLVNEKATSFTCKTYNRHLYSLPRKDDGGLFCRSLVTQSLQSRCCIRLESVVGSCNLMSCSRTSRI
jgi:hypothetical protein